MPTQLREKLLDAIGHDLVALEYYRRLEQEFTDEELQGNMGELADQLERTLEKRRAVFSEMYPDADLEAELKSRGNGGVKS